MAAGPKEVGVAEDRDWQGGRVSKPHGQWRRGEVWRWVWVLPAAAIAGYGVLLAGLAATLLANELCPWGEIVSGLCTARWLTMLQSGIDALSAMAAALLAVLAAGRVAPRAKPLVAAITCAVCSLLAAGIAIVPLLAATLGGVVGVWRCRCRR